MEQITYLAKLGELTLKGGNLKEFERRLVCNTQLYLEGVNAHVILRAGRMYIECDEDACGAVEFTLNHLIGITGWAKTLVCEKTVEAIKECCMQEALRAKAAGAKTFKIEVRRAQKTFPLNSYELAAVAAGDIYDQGLLGVDVHHPDVCINIEIREKCYVFSDQNKGCRGLPVGSSSRGLLLLSGGLDSPVAGYRMLRRGMRIDCVYFHAYPYTSAEAQKKVEDLAERLSFYGLDVHINVVPFTEVQMCIKEKSPEPFSTLLLRMCMMKVANLIAAKIHASCIITGESLGQVASQTIENMTVTESMCEYPLIRPLVGLDKEEIVETANFIDTYNISILPYEDCCVLFSPKHPVLRARVEEAKEIYDSLQVDDLIQKAFEEREIKLFSAREYVLKTFCNKQ